MSRPTTTGPVPGSTIAPGSGASKNASTRASKDAIAQRNLDDAVTHLTKRLSKVERDTRLALTVAETEWDDGFNTLTQLVANTNNWAFDLTAKNYRVDSNANYNITGLVAGPVARKRIAIFNFGAFVLTFQNQDVLSAAENRIITGTGAGIPIAPGQAIDLIYDAVTTRWRAV